MGSDLIHIQHFDARYRVSISRDDPSSVQRRLDRIARDIFPHLRKDDIPHTTLSDDVICFIERMEITMVFDLSRSDDRGIAATWSRALHEGIRMTIGQQGNNVVVFRDRGEFLSGFLSDLLHGRAWECWYYQEFAEARSLTIGQAILKVLSADGDIGRDVLLELTRRGDLEVFLAALTDDEVEAIVSRCLLPPGPDVAFQHLYAAWVQAIRHVLDSRNLALTSVLSRDVARLYLYLLRDHPELGPDVNLARFIRDLLHLRQAILEMEELHSLLSWIESEDIRAVMRQLGQGQGQHLLEGQHLLAGLIRELTGPQVVALLKDLQGKSPQPVTKRISTPYGGLFLLIPTMVEMGLHDFLNKCQYPEPQGMSKGGLLLFLTGVQCLGSKNAEKAVSDKGLSFLAGLSAPPARSHLRHYAQTLTPEMHESFVQSFGVYRREVERRSHMLIQLQKISTEQGGDLEWFLPSSEAEPLQPDRAWDLAISKVSSLVLRCFSLKLGAFAGSSPAYLSKNFLESHAEIEVFADRIAVDFLICPLQMVLRMAGFDHIACAVPWLENCKLEFHFHS